MNSTFAIIWNMAEVRCEVVPLPCVADEILPGLSRACAMKFASVVALTLPGLATHHRDRHERCRIVAEPAIEVLVDDERRSRRRQQRIAVRFRTEGRLGADIASGSRLVLDDDGLAPFARQDFEYDARHKVCRAAGRKRHDDLDGAMRIIEGRCGSDQCRHDCTATQQGDDEFDCPTAQAKYPAP